MNMRDIIHLVIYELTVTRGQRFHSISRDVAPFIWQNWEKLVVPVEVRVIFYTFLVHFISFGGNFLDFRVNLIFFDTFQFLRQFFSFFGYF